MLSSYDRLPLKIRLLFGSFYFGKNEEVLEILSRCSWNNITTKQKYLLRLKIIIKFSLQNFSAMRMELKVNSNYWLRQDHIFKVLNVLHNNERTKVLCVRFLFMEHCWSFNLPGSQHCYSYKNLLSITRSSENISIQH